MKTEEYVLKMKKEIKEEIVAKRHWQKDARNTKQKELEAYCNGALTQLYDFLERIEILEKLDN